MSIDHPRPYEDFLDDVPAPLLGVVHTASKPPRSEVLLEAERLINGDRNLSYGKPTQNFENIAAVWTVQLSHILKDGESITPSQVAQLMASLKLVRMIASPRRDNWIDLAGYAGCGYECDLEAGNAE